MREIGPEGLQEIQIRGCAGVEALNPHNLRRVAEFEAGVFAINPLENSKVTPNGEEMH